MSSSIPRESLNEILRVDRASDLEFTAMLENFWGSPMGADAWARAALAAARSCEGAELLSLHGYLDGGLTLEKPLSFQLDALEESDGVARCTVRLVQGAPRGRVLASFAPAGEGPDYQDVAPSETLPDPESLPSTLAQARAEGWPEEYARGPLEFRRVGSIVRDAEQGDSYHHLIWLKPRAPVADDPALQTAALVFASGFYPHWEFERRLGPKFAHPAFRILDQALQVHHHEPWDDWWLLEARNEIAGGGRALSTRRLYTRSGRLLASASSHALIATT